ncbi:MAG: 50S ribosomal protein L18 [bacterium]
MSVKQQKRLRRHKKIRKSMHGTAERPRLCVFRSNQHIYAQLIDDDKAKVLAVVSDMDLKGKKPASAKGSGGAKSDMAKEVGKLIAKKAIEMKAQKVIFDRGGVLYHGRIKALAEGAREGGLIF